MARQTGYVLDTDVECDRLERQALLQAPECVLKHTNVGPGMRVLDAGTGSGAVARLLAQSFPQAEIVGMDIHPQYVEYAQKLRKPKGYRT